MNKCIKGLPCFYVAKYTNDKGENKETKPCVFSFSLCHELQVGKATKLDTVFIAQKQNDKCEEVVARPNTVAEKIRIQFERDVRRVLNI
jgi:hypothetical protein